MGSGPMPLKRCEHVFQHRSLATMFRPASRKCLAWKMSLTASRSTHSAGAGGRYAPCSVHQSAEARLPSEGALAAHLDMGGRRQQTKHQATGRKAVLAARESSGSRESGP